MIVATAAEMKVWEAYALVKVYNFYIVFLQYYIYAHNFDSNILISFVQTNSEARGMQNKVIENWDDIVLLCGKDRATGEGAETYEDGLEAMATEEENEVESAPMVHAPTRPSSSTIFAPE